MLWQYNHKKSSSDNNVMAVTDQRVIIIIDRKFFACLFKKNSLARVFLHIFKKTQSAASQDKHKHLDMQQCI